ncbi:Xylosyltransferase oxt [Cytospora mali]|uniref:Xylosyltransferase oxt n=1 Tax=Cytospora mali TaxID=578113 RepID=A0A194VQ34_CYTMA|nr:Xylosyltransferase oxt [Valsa mali]
MARTVTSIPLTINLALTALILLTSIPTSPAQQQPTVYNNSMPYSYIGCYHETTDLPNTNGARALNDGKVWVGPEYMTVPMCLDFCGGGSGEVYNYAGLEYSRECWCAKSLNGLAAKLDDSACTLQCDGDATQLCGGSLKLSLYLMRSSPVMINSSATESLNSAQTTVESGSGVESSSTKMVVTGWMILWVTAAMVVNRN